MKNSKKIGLSLSGGGARGIAHLGLLKALEELSIRPDILSGTSAGAMVSAFYGAGFSITEIFKVISDNDFFKWQDFAFSKQGLLKVNSNEKLLRRFLGDLTFDKLRLPVYLSATDVQKAEVLHLDSGDVVSAILASSAIPFLFEPVQREGRFLIDGSAGDCFPVNAIRDKCDVLIGSYVNPVAETQKKLEMSEIVDRSYHLSLKTEVEVKRKICDVYLSSDLLSAYSMFDFKSSQAIFDIGYKHAILHRDELLRVLD